jgi:hypothetical protein
MSATVRAADPLGLYIGGSLGEADVRSKYAPDPLGPLTFAGTDVGWKMFFGARPISFAGIEVAMRGAVIRPFRRLGLCGRSRAARGNRSDAAYCPRVESTISPIGSGWRQPAKSRWIRAPHDRP